VTALSSVWLFGYGSLIWNPGFAYAERRKGVLSGWSLRFWQGSEDHRGTPESPGRVATLVRDPPGRVVGAVYRIEGDHDAILAYLDHREKGGYGRLQVEIATESGPLAALAYVGPPHAREYVGPEDEALTARIIKDSCGPSGRNVDYLLSLHQALQEMGEADPHVESLVSLLKAVG
jgi:cation transport regulator ChaC